MSEPIASPDPYSGRSMEAVDANETVRVPEQAARAQRVRGTMKKTTRLKELINAPEILVMYPAHDALSARIAERAGAKAVTVGGFAASGVFGQPDSSQLTATELAKFYEGICASVDIPVFVDADTGFGGVTNVIRTVKDFERAGVAGLFIEDQRFPKRCGHTAGKDIISTEEMAALDSRTDEDFVIMGRTDALGVLGIDEAIIRANLYRETGCDVLFVEAPETTEQMRRICEEVHGPVLANMVEFGRSPLLDAEGKPSTTLNPAPDTAKDK